MSCIFLIGLRTRLTPTCMDMPLVNVAVHHVNATVQASRQRPRHFSHDQEHVVCPRGAS